MILAVVMAGCSRADDADSPSSPPIVDASAVQEPEAVEPATETVPVPVVPGVDLPGTVDRFVVAGTELTLDTAAAGAPIQQTSTAVVAGVGTAGEVVGTAVSVAVPGLEPAPVEVDLETTALTQLLTSPTFATDNPLSTMLVAGVARESDHLRTLAQAIGAAGASSGSVLDDPTELEAQELDNLVRDVQERLQVLADEAGVSSTQDSGDVDASAGQSDQQAARQGGDGDLGAARAGVTSTATKGAATSPATYVRLASVASTAENGWGDSECLRVDNGRGLYQAHEASGSPWCATTRATGDGYQVEITSSAGMWAMVMLGDDPLTGSIFSAVPPQQFVLPTVSDIVQAVLMTGVVSVAAKFEPIICAGAELLGTVCPESVQEFSGFWQTLADELNPVKEGSTSFYVDATDAAQPLLLVTSGRAGFGLPSPNDWLGASDEAALAETFTDVASIYSQMIDPLLAMVLNLRSRQREEPEDATAREEAITAVRQHFLSDSTSVDGASAPGNLIDAAAADAAVAEGEIGPVVEAIAGVTLDVVTTPELYLALGRWGLRGLRGLQLPEAAARIATSLGARFAKLANPAGAVVGAADGVVDLVNLLAGVANYTYSRYTTLSRVIMIPDVASSGTPDDLRYHDWSDPDLQLVAQVAGDGIPAEEAAPVRFPLGDPPPGIASVEPTAAVVGRWRGKDTIALGFWTYPENDECNFLTELSGACEYDEFHINLVVPRKGLMQVVGHVSFVDPPDPATDYVNGETRCLDEGVPEVVAAFEGGALVEYRSFLSDGVLVPGCVFRAPLRTVGLSVTGPRVARLDYPGQTPYRGSVPRGVYWRWD